jgi:hypothetical protein
VENLLQGMQPADYVIALTDVYTGNHPPDFIDAQDAKTKMVQRVRDEPRFYPHVAQYDPIHLRRSVNSITHCCQNI